MAIIKKKYDPDEKLSKDQIDMLKEMDDREIDYSDIPEFTAEQLKQFKRVNKPVTKKSRLTSVKR